MFTDGAARGNPGPAGAGVVLYDENGNELETFKKYLGTATNNVAEYNALICGLEVAKKYLPCALDIFLDSELVVNQMLGIYKVRDEKLIKFFGIARQLVNSFETANFCSIPRTKNKVADELANQAINLAKISLE
jgi:ribonuclease HI